MSLDHAIELAIKNPIKGYPRMAAVLYNKRKFVSSGYNKIVTHPLQAKFCRHEKAIYLHAEIAAIVAAKKSVENMIMYVARVRRDDTPAIAKPCVGCQKALSFFKVKDVFWT